MTSDRKSLIGKLKLSLIFNFNFKQNDTPFILMETNAQ